MESVRARASTEGLEGNKALSFWEDHLFSVGLRGKISLVNDTLFSAKAVYYKFGESRLYLYRMTPSLHERSQSDCTQNPSDVFSLSYVNKGAVVVKQNQKESLVNAGGCFLTYSGEPRSYNIVTPSEATSLLLPRALLQRWVPFPFDITAQPLLDLSPFGKALASTLAALSSPELKEISVPPDAIVEQICCLLALVAGPPKTVSTSYREALFYRLRHTLRTRCCDQGFNQTLLARAHNLSTRTVQTTFSSAGTSFGKELLDLRMRKARWFLDDLRYDKKSISEIAGFLGYRHPSHFITHFRQTYGHTPSEYREIRKI
ncbi:MAG: AraC family transcriptional regulator [Bdellovibrionales bacterium]